MTREALRSSDGAFAACEDVHMHERGSLKVGKEVGVCVKFSGVSGSEDGGWVLIAAL